MSCCLSSSRLKITRRFGRYCFSMISTNFFPKDPVPPVTRIDCSDQFIHPPRHTAADFNVAGVALPASIADFLRIVRIVSRPQSSEEKFGVAFPDPMLECRTNSPVTLG